MHEVQAPAATGVLGSEVAGLTVTILVPTFREKQMLIDQFTLEMLPARYAGHISVRPSNKDEARAILASRGTHVVGLVERNKELGSPTP